MAEQRKKPPQHFTPAGVSVWPHLHKPDTKFDADGVYKTDLVLDGDDERTQQLMEMIDHKVQEAVEHFREEATTAAAKKKIIAADPPYRMEEDEEGNETGRVVFRFKSKASGKKKDGGRWERKLALFDAKRNPLESVPIYNGSILKINFSFSDPWKMDSTKQAGVTLRINAVQVIELKNGGATDGADYGFAEEDGYEYEGGGASDSDDSDDDDGASGEEDF